MANTPQMMAPQPGSVPVPDPTLRTIENILREVANARSEANASVQSLKDVFETRLDAMDKAIELLQKTTDRFPGHVANEVNTLKQLHAEKFESIQTQFRERDTRTDQTSRDTKTAIDAALQAQKEAAGKSEVSFTKQIDQITLLIQQAGQATNDKIDDVKERIGQIERNSVGRISQIELQSGGRLTAIESNKQGGTEVWGYVVGALGLLGLITSVGLAVAKL